MAPQSKTSTLLCLALSLYGALGSPTPKNLAARDTTVPLPTDLVPTIIDGGSLTSAELASVIASVPKPDTTLAGILKRQEPQSGLATRQPTVDENAFLTSGWGNLTGTDFDETPFEMLGPFSAITASMGASDIVGLTLTDMNGNTQTFTGAVSPPPLLPPLYGLGVTALRLTNGTRYPIL
jgi:hypothetical protein